MSDWRKEEAEEWTEGDDQHSGVNPSCAGACEEGGMWMSMEGSLVPSPMPSFSSIAVRTEATKSWAWDWEWVYMEGTCMRICTCVHVSVCMCVCYMAWLATV